MLRNVEHLRLSPIFRFDLLFPILSSCSLFLEEWLSSQPQEVQDRVILGGPCILVQGESLAKAQGKL